MRSGAVRRPLRHIPSASPSAEDSRGRGSSSSAWRTPPPSPSGAKRVGLGPRGPDVSQESGERGKWRSHWDPVGGRARDQKRCRSILLSPPRRSGADVRNSGNSTLQASHWPGPRRYLGKGFQADSFLEGKGRSSRNVYLRCKISATSIDDWLKSTASS